jgi:hypothetical protein
MFISFLDKIFNLSCVIRKVLQNHIWFIVLSHRTDLVIRSNTVSLGNVVRINKESRFRVVDFTSRFSDLFAGKLGCIDVDGG